MPAESHEIVVAFIGAGKKGSKTKRVACPAPTRRIDHRVATVEAEIRLTLDYLAVATPVYAGGTLVEGDEGVPTKVVWDFHFDSSSSSRPDNGFMGSGYTIRTTQTERYGFDSLGNLLYSNATTNDYGRRFGDEKARIIKSSSLSRQEQFELMGKLHEFRTRLDLTSINT